MSLSHQTFKFEAAGGSSVNEQILDKNTKAGDDDEKIEENDDLDQHRHSGHENLRAQKDAVLEHQETEDLTDGFMSHGEHQKADQLHRQHDRKREHRNGRPQAQATGRRGN